MSMIARYQKKGGFIQLLTLIETTGGDKKEKFLKMIKDESPAWEAEVRKKALSMERILKWPTQTLMEFIPMIPPQNLAYAIYPLTQEQKDHILSALDFSAKRKIEEFKDAKPNPGEVAASQTKILTEIRNMSNTGKFNFAKFDADLVLPENIEDLLKNGGTGFSDSGASAPSQGSGVMSDSIAEVNALLGAIPAGAPPQLVEEMNLLRKKVLTLSQEIHRLNKENKDLKDRFDSIKEIVRKVA